MEHKVGYASMQTLFSFPNEHTCETDFLRSTARWRDGGHPCVTACSPWINGKPATLSFSVPRWAKSCRIVRSHYSVHLMCNWFQDYRQEGKACQAWLPPVNAGAREECNSANFCQFGWGRVESWQGDSLLVMQLHSAVGNLLFGAWAVTGCP